MQLPDSAVSNTPKIAPALHPRDGDAHVLPVSLPREFERYGSGGLASAPGSTGKRGLMELEFERIGDKTRLVHHYYRSPLQMFQPLYYDRARPDMPYIVLLQNGGGMVQGDRYRVDITCREGASAHITTQSAGKLYKCDENYITQVIDVTAEADSLVEFLPDMTIPFQGSRFFQHIGIRLDPTATVIVGDVLAPGRVARNEAHRYDIFHAQLEATDLDGRLLVADTIKLEPRHHSPKSPAMLGAFDALGVLYIFTQRQPAGELVSALRTALDADARTVSGVSELPNRAGVSVRILGVSAYHVELARTLAWDTARRALFGVPAPDMRKA